MSCPYYWYNNHYACRKTGKDVNDDIYYKYCRNYDYDYCPIYKGEESSGCFITSACVEAMGKGDDCYELRVLRSFRDEYLRLCSGGLSEIAEYYFVAPQIVSRINIENDSISTFKTIFENLVQPCVELIECGKNEEAHELYRQTVKELQLRFLEK